MNRFLFFSLFVMCSCVSLCQTLEEKLASIKGKKDLKVGLVLSGGGAKGIAHVAVIEAIEKAGIRIDYIGGTSMGAMVGGLYAAGYNAKQLDSIFRKLDFTKMINDYIPRSSRTFYEKENKDRYIVSLPFKKGSISVPSGYSKGNNLYSFFVQLTYPVRDINDFSRLPIPFLCVATNAENGKEKILEYGDLATCIVASGALPGVFSPVEIDGEVFIDGGLVNNYPVKQIREKGMDVIIGVDIQAPLLNKDELGSAVDILMQTTSYKVAGDHPKKIKDTDLYIKPNMYGYNAMSFDSAHAILDSGKVEVSKHLESLRKIAKMQKTSYIHTAKPSDSLYIDDIKFFGNKHYSQQYLRGKLRFNWDKTISFQELTDGVQNLIATRNFRSLRYNLCPSEKNPLWNDLHFFVVEDQTKTFIKAGIHYDRLYKTSVLVNVTQKTMLQKNDVFSFDFIAGDNLRLSAEYYVDNGFYTSYGIRAKLNRFDRDVSQNILKSAYNLNSIGIDFSEFLTQIYIQTIYEDKFLTGLGIEARDIQISSNTINADEIFENTVYFSPYVYIKYDSLNETDIPTKGILFNLNSSYTFASKGKRELKNNFLYLHCVLGGAKSLTHRLSSLASVSAGAIFGKDIPISMSHILGGSGINTPSNMHPFVGCDYLSFVGNSYIKSKLELDYRFYSNYYITSVVNVANISRENLGLNDLISFPKYYGYSIGLLTKTIIGPISLAFEYSPQSKKPMLVFNLGFWF